MTVFFLQERILDPQKCWDDWIAEGSLSKVRRKYTEEGLVNPATGVSPNESAIQKSAYSWAISTPESLKIARERFEHECRERAIVPTDEMWNDRLYRMGRLLFYQRPGRMKEFIEKHGLQKYAASD